MTSKRIPNHLAGTPARVTTMHQKTPEYRLNGMVIVGVCLVLCPLCAICASDPPPFPSAAFFQLLLQQSPDEWDALADISGMTDVDREAILYFSQRLRDRISAYQMWDAARQNMSAEMSSGDRGQIFRLEGTVVQVDEVVISPAEQERFELKHLYRVTLSTQLQEHVVIFTTIIPFAWHLGEQSIPAAAADAVLFASYGSTPAFVARRIEWRPQDSLLARLGMDIGTLDQVPPQVDHTANPRAVRWTDADTEPFYQMLGAVGKTRRGALAEIVAKEITRPDPEETVFQLFNRPQECQGRLFSLTGIAKRVTKIPLHNPELQVRFGLDHYYEIYLFPDESQGNPIVLCVCELPPGMPVGDEDDYAEQIFVTGFFYKKWAYRVQDMTSDEAQGRRLQLAPVLVAKNIVWYPHPKSSGDGRYAPYVFGGFAVLAAIWVIYRLRRAVKR